MTLRTLEKNGLFDLVFEDRGFRNAGFRIRLSDVLLKSSGAIPKGREESFHEDIAGRGKLLEYHYGWQGTGVEAGYRVFLCDELPCACISVKVNNKGNSPVFIERITPLAVGNGGIVLGSGLRDWVLYKNGIRKNDPAGCHHFGDPGFDINDVAAKGHEEGSSAGEESGGDILINSGYMSVLYSSSSGKSILTGFYTMDRQFAFTDFVCDKSEQDLISYEAYCELDGLRLEPGDSLSSEKTLIDFDEPFRAVERYADTAARAGKTASGGGKTSGRGKHPPTGWCSWYFFYESVTEKDVLDNMAFIRENNLPLEYIQVDMGWEQRLGDWHPNYRFPSGMKWLADKIHSCGYRAGIWLSPFWVEPRSQVHREHPEWLLKDKNGELIVFHCHIDGYVIDTTVPEARRWIRENFRRVTEEWGYDYLKIDFLRAVSMFPEACYANPSTRAQALRSGLEAVREGAGGETFILACGGQYGPSLGIADGNRMSNDIGGSWDSLKFTFKKNIARYWTHGAWWMNDPDCLLLRGPEEGTPGRVAGSLRSRLGGFTDSEVRTILTLFRAAGAMVFSGDDLTRLKPEKSDLLGRWVLPPSGRPAVPVDLFENRFPRILHTSPGSGRHEVAIINWGEKPLRETLALEKILGKRAGNCGFRVTETWSNNCLGVYGADDRITPGTIDPHGCMHLEIIRERG